MRLCKMCGAGFFCMADALGKEDTAELVLTHLNLPQLLRVRQTCQALRQVVDGLAIWVMLLQALGDLRPPSGLGWVTDGIGRLVIEDGVLRGQRDPRCRGTWPALSAFEKCSKLLQYLLLEVAQRSAWTPRPRPLVLFRYIITLFIPTTNYFPAKKMAEERCDDLHRLMGPTSLVRTISSTT